MSADVLREAAALMRVRAHAATPGPWHVSDNLPVTNASDLFAGALWIGQTHGRKQPFRENAEHIAAWHPAVALAVADWLDRMAPWEVVPSTARFREAVVVARAYLGRPS